MPIGWRRPLQGSNPSAGAPWQSIKPLNNCTIDGEARASELSTARPRNQTILHEGQDLKFFAHLTSITLIDRVLRPLEQLGIPGWTVIQGICWYSADNIIGPETIR